MTYLPTQEDLALLTSRSKHLYSRIELLNKDYQIIDSIEGIALNGSTSNDADSDTRRTFNLDIFPQKGFSISQFEVEDWTTKMLRLYVGMKAPTSKPYIAVQDNGGMSDADIKAAILSDPIYKEVALEFTKKVWYYTDNHLDCYGNISNVDRPRIVWTKKNLEKYADFVKENSGIKEGDYSTVCGCDGSYEISLSNTNEDGAVSTAKKTFQIAYTPLLVCNNEIVPLLQDDVSAYINKIIALLDGVQITLDQVPAKLIELDAVGLDCDIYGKATRIKNLLAAVSDGTVAGRTLSAVDVSAIAGWSEKELQEEYGKSSWFVGKSMHDIQGELWELTDGMTQVYNFYYTDMSSKSKVRSSVNYVDTDGIHWFGEGVYAIQQNGYTYDAATNKLSLSCLDLTCMLDGTLGGTLTGYATRIPMYEQKLVVENGIRYYEDDKTKPHYIRQSIKETFELSGLTKSMVDYWVRRIPHDLEYNTGTTIWNILTELRDLYYPFEMYFDDDTFVCKEIPSGYDDPVVLDEDIFKSLVISENSSVDYSQIHNCIEVWGASNSSNYFCKDGIQEEDPDGTGEVIYCKKGTKEWDDVIKVMTNNSLNVSYNLDVNKPGASILHMKLKNAEIGDGTSISFICPEDISEDTHVCIENTIVTKTVVDNKPFDNIEKAVYGPMMIYKAVTNENGEDEPAKTSEMKKGRYYVIKYGETYIDQAKDGAYSYEYNTITGEYEKVPRDTTYRYEVVQEWDTETKQYVIRYYKYDPATNIKTPLNDPALIKESRVYFLGQSQSHAMVKFVDTAPDEKQIAADKVTEACDNLEYVVVNDPQRIDSLYNSRLTIDKIGRRNYICSGGEYEGYTSDESAMTVAKYMLWKNCRLTDSITLKMHLVPWLDVNEKVKYAANYLKSKIAVEWLIKKIDTNIGEGTMSVTLSRYYPYYPYITYENVLKKKYSDSSDDE